MVCTNKAIYLPKDVERMSEYMKVDFKLPSVSIFIFIHSLTCQYASLFILLMLSPLF